MPFSLAIQSFSQRLAYWLPLCRSGGAAGAVAIGAIRVGLIRPIHAATVIYARGVGLWGGWRGDGQEAIPLDYMAHLRLLPCRLSAEGGELMNSFILQLPHSPIKVEAAQLHVLLWGICAHCDRRRSAPFTFGLTRPVVTFHAHAHCLSCEGRDRLMRHPPSSLHSEH